MTISDRRRAVDQTAVLIAHAASWSNNSLCTHHLGEAHHESIRAAAAAQDLDRATERIRLRSARYAAAAFPGPVGELISREIRTYVDAGEQLPAYALAPRLVADMTTWELRNPLPPIPDAAPRYVPGTAMHFRSPTAADEPDPAE